MIQSIASKVQSALEVLDDRSTSDVSALLIIGRLLRILRLQRPSSHIFDGKLSTLMIALEDAASSAPAGLEALIQRMGGRSADAIALAFARDDACSLAACIETLLMAEDDPSAPGGDELVDASVSTAADELEELRSDLDVFVTALDEEPQQTPDQAWESALRWRSNGAPDPLQVLLASSSTDDDAWWTTGILVAELCVKARAKEKSWSEILSLGLLVPAPPAAIVDELGEVGDRILALRAEEFGESTHNPSDMELLPPLEVSRRELSNQSDVDGRVAEQSALRDALGALGVVNATKVMPDGTESASTNAKVVQTETLADKVTSDIPSLRSLLAVGERLIGKKAIELHGAVDDLDITWVAKTDAEFIQVHLTAVDQDLLVVGRVTPNHPVQLVKCTLLAKDPSSEEPLESFEIESLPLTGYGHVIRGAISRLKMTHPSISIESIIWEII